MSSYYSNSFYILEINAFIAKLQVMVRVAVGSAPSYEL